MGGATDGLRQLVVVEDEDAQLFQALEGAGVDEADAVAAQVQPAQLGRRVEGAGFQTLQQQQQQQQQQQ